MIDSISGDKQSPRKSALESLRVVRHVIVDRNGVLNQELDGGLSQWEVIVVHSTPRQFSAACVAPAAPPKFALSTCLQTIRNYGEPGAFAEFCGDSLITATSRSELTTFRSSAESSPVAALSFKPSNRVSYRAFSRSWMEL